MEALTPQICNFCLHGNGVSGINVIKERGLGGRAEPARCVPVCPSVPVCLLGIEAFFKYIYKPSLK